MRAQYGIRVFFLIFAFAAVILVMQQSIRTKVKVDFWSSTVPFKNETVERMSSAFKEHGFVVTSGPLLANSREFTHSNFHGGKIVFRLTQRGERLQVSGLWSGSLPYFSVSSQYYEEKARSLRDSFRQSLSSE